MPTASSPKVWQGFNDLATVKPELASQWHPTKNGDLKPTDVTANSNKTVWWLLPYDDPVTNKHFDFVWQAIISRRKFDGSDNPYLDNKLILKGFNDFETWCILNNKEYLLTEWDKSNKIKPYEVSKGSSKIINWICSKKHKWSSILSDRTRNHNCPICMKEYKVSYNETSIYYYINKVFNAIQSYNEYGFEIDIFIPDLNLGIEYDGYYWHNDKIDKDIAKNKLCEDNNIKLIRIREPKLKTLNGYSIDISLKDTKEITINDCIKQIFDIIKNDYKKEFNIPLIDINKDSVEILECMNLIEKNNSLQYKFPELMQYWDKDKNKNLNPNCISYGSQKKVWWICKFNHSYNASIYSKTSGNQGCPICSGKQVLIGFNDLATLNPELARQWHPTRNGDLKPTDVTICSGKTIWWLYPYDDPITGKHFDFEWSATVASRKNNEKCPYLTKCTSYIWQGFNDLETINPELASEWHPTKNGELKPTQVKIGSNKVVWWKCSKCNYEWEAKIVLRGQGKYNCPNCHNKHTIT